jgi:hypothetical protein
MAPGIAGTAMSLVMGVGFAGLLVIPPAVGYVSNALRGDAGNLRAEVVAIIAASVFMLAFHILLTLRERRRSFLSEDALERDAVVDAK